MYDRFKDRHPNEKIGLTSFIRLKPPYVRRVSDTSKRSCLCTICCNIALKAEAVKKLINSNEELKKLNLLTDKKEISSMTVCENSGCPKADCLDRRCTSCGVSIITNHYKKLVEFCGKEKTEVPWYKWEYITIKKDSKEKRIMSCCQKVFEISFIYFQLFSIRTLCLNNDKKDILQ